MHWHLPARIAARLEALRLERQRQQAAGGLLAGRGDHVELAAIRHCRDLARQTEQAVGFAGHGRGYDHDLVAGRVPLGDPPGDVLDAFDRTHRGSAVFVNEDRHDIG